MPTMHTIQLRKTGGVMSLLVVCSGVVVVSSSPEYCACSVVVSLSGEVTIGVVAMLAHSPPPYVTKEAGDGAEAQEPTADVRQS